MAEDGPGVVIGLSSDVDATGDGAKGRVAADPSNAPAQLVSAAM